MPRLKAYEPMTHNAIPRSSLTRYAWLSIMAAIITIGLKAGAYLLTGSVSLLSDALESGVNLIAAIIALSMLAIAARPPDEEHPYGHDKAEYFSSGAEGILILIAAIGIARTAWERLLHPQPIEQVGLGLSISLVASLINFAVAWQLLNAGKKHTSITLEADAHHLMSDVWTSIGVVAGIGAVALTGWQRLDPLIALVVAANIVWAGVGLIRRTIAGLMDTALPKDELARIQAILENYSQKGVHYHHLRTRQAGTRRFISVHILVPGTWTVQEGHTLLEQIEQALHATLSDLSIVTHLEPLDDPASWEQKPY